jgi:hypothetical protein
MRIRTLWWIVISGALHNFNVYAINAFQTPFLQRYHMLNLRNAALVSALVVGLVGAIGLLGGGWASDRLSRRRADGRLLLAAGTMMASVPLRVPRARAAARIDHRVHDSDGSRHHAELRLLRHRVRGHPGRRRAAVARQRRGYLLFRDVRHGREHGNVPHGQAVRVSREAGNGGRRVRPR